LEETRDNVRLDELLVISRGHRLNLPCLTHVLLRRLNNPARFHSEQSFGWKRPMS
jgi:hypothetical protein